MASALSTTFERRRSEKPRIERRPHEPPECDIGYYDPELDVPTSPTHNAAMYDLHTKLAPIAKARGLVFMSDNSIWYLEPNTGKQKVLYPDVVFATRLDSVTAEDALLVIEIVSTHDARKERKDTVQQRQNNEFNQVPEFGLYFPDVDDERVFELFRWDPVSSSYVSVPRSENGRFASASMPGLEFEVLPVEVWQDGVKMDVYFEGQRCLSFEEQRLRADREAERAQREADARREAETSERLATQRSEKLAAKLRALGIDPDAD